MRTKSIIYIIRRYGLSSKRLSPKSKIKYEDAIKGLESYESAELKITDVIDNVVFPEKSVSDHCQLPGCNHPIRYEYVLTNKKTGEQFVAGSTCVWPTLGMSELQKKEFLSYEAVVKEYHEMIQWRRDNPDVVEKLETAKNAELIQFRPFWREIEHSALMEEDTEYIRSQDMNKIIRDREERERARREYQAMTSAQRIKYESEYSKVVSALRMLCEAYPENDFYKSLDFTVKRGRRLSPRQVKCIKVGANKKWYEDNIKGTERDKVYEKCDDILNDLLRGVGFEVSSYTSEMLEAMDKAVAGTGSKVVVLAWKLYKVKHEVVA